MNALRISVSIALLWLAAPRPGAAADADAVLGVWSTENGTARVEIAKRGELYYGTIVWLEEPLHPTDPTKPDYYAGHEGQPKVDGYNPDEKLRDRPILGLELLNGLRYAGGEVWKGGRIYDPESGRTYSCEITLASPAELKVRGYLGISLIGRTTLWTRP